MSSPISQDPDALGSGRPAGYSVVVATTGSRAVAELLKTLDHAAGPRPESVIIVGEQQHLPDPERGFGALTLPITVLPSAGQGVAAARNTGWQHSRSEWITFLDQDSVISHDWPQQLVTDLSRCTAADAGSAATIRATDAARPTPGEPRWSTVDLAYRRSALAEVGGFDEDFRYGRDGSDLALRMIDAGYRIATGRRVTQHPGSPADRSGWLAGVHLQRGNTDDAVMLARHGRNWRRDAGAGRGHLAEYALTTAAGVGSLGLLIGGRRRSAAVAAGLWTALTARFAVARLRNGTMQPSEIGHALADSALVPPAACFHRVRGELDVLTAGRSTPRRRASDRGR